MVILLIRVLHISKRYNGLRLIRLASVDCLIRTLAPWLAMFAAKPLVDLLCLWYPFLVRPLGVLAFTTAFLLIGDVIVHLSAGLPSIAQSAGDTGPSLLESAASGAKLRLLVDTQHLLLLDAIQVTCRFRILK